MAVGDQASGVGRPDAAIGSPVSDSRFPEWEDMVLVGRIARPHGLRGQVAVNPETDFVEERFRPGATLWSKGEFGIQQLTIAASRVQNGRPIVAFDGLGRIEDVEVLAGRELRIPEFSLRPLAPGQYYEHQLVGCVVETVAGVELGTVVRVEGGAGGSRLIVDGRRSEIQIPLVEGICSEIDIAAKRIKVEPPEGLVELNETRRGRR